MNAFDVLSGGARWHRRDGPRSLSRTSVIPDWRALYPAMSGEMGKPGPSGTLPAGPWPPGPRPNHPDPALRRDRFSGTGQPPDRQLRAPGAPAPCLTAGPAVSQPPSPLAGTAEESLRRLDLYIRTRQALDGEWVWSAPPSVGVEH